MNYLLQHANPRSLIEINFNAWGLKLGSVSGPVIHANERLTTEDDLRSVGLLGFTTQQTCVCTGLADSMVTLEEPKHG